MANYIKVVTNKLIFSDIEQTDKDLDSLVKGEGITALPAATDLGTPKVDIIAEKTAMAGITIDGLLIKDNGHAFVGARAYLSADQDNISAGGADWYKIALDTESYDIGSNFDTVNNRFVVPTTGYYQVNGLFYPEVADISAAVIFCVAIYVDPLGVGTPVAKSYGIWVKAAAATDYLGCLVSDTIHLIATDRVYLYCYSSETDTDVESGEARTFMSIALLGI